MAIYLRAKGRTSPPAKTIGHRESINPTLVVLKLVAQYLITTIYFNMLQTKTGPIVKDSQKKSPTVTTRKNDYVRTYVLTHWRWVPVVGPTENQCFFASRRPASVSTEDLLHRRQADCYSNDIAWKWYIMAIYLRAKARTSPPAKTIGHRESINPALAVLKLVATYNNLL